MLQTDREATNSGKITCESKTYYIKTLQNINIDRRKITDINVRTDVYKDNRWEWNGHLILRVPSKEM